MSQFGNDMFNGILMNQRQCIFPADLFDDVRQILRRVTELVGIIS